jgi:hypothetical protein
MWRNGWAPNSIPIHWYIQQDATLHNLFISGNCPTCFGWYFHPSSGAHTAVSTASGICHNTDTAICRYRGRVGTGLSVLWVAYVSILPPAQYWVRSTHTTWYKLLHLQIMIFSAMPAANFESHRPNRNITYSIKILQVNRKELSASSVEYIALCLWDNPQQIVVYPSNKLSFII